MTRTTLAAFAAICLAVAASLAHAAPGDLDSSFGSGGHATTMFGPPSTVYALAQLDDGRIVAAGNATFGGKTSFALARYNTTGSLDTTFGGGGFTSTAFSSGNSGARAIAVQPDGKLVAAGRDTAGGFAIARYNANGPLDSTFGTNGMATFNFGMSAAEARGVAVQPDGKIVVAGFATNGSSLVVVVVARLEANGTLDTTFDGDGFATLELSYDTHTYALDLQPDGKIVVAGKYNSFVTASFFAARFNNDGTLDSGFGNAGTTYYAGATGTDFALVRQASGKLVVAGSRYNPDTAFMEFALVRFNADGTGDSSFGANPSSGLVRLAFPGGNAAANSVVLDAADRIIVSGIFDNGGRGYGALARFSADGSGDPTFAGGQGIIDTHEAIDARIYAALQTDDGKVVTGGIVNAGPFALARYLMEDTAPSTTLTVAKDGNGSGTVTGSGIECGDTCSHTYPPGSPPVTLHASAAAGAAFVGWSGGGCSGSGDCTVTLDGDKTVTATFVASNPTLTIVKAGGGSGLVTGNGIDCGADCSEVYVNGTLVTLSATAGTGSTFLGWSGGGCTGTGTCQFTITADTTVTATLTRMGGTATDFNGDGRPDLLWSNASNGATFVWIMNGLALDHDEFITQIDPSWKIVGTGDFNGDGHTDLIWRNTANGSTYVWYLVGSAFQSDAFLLSLDPSWLIAAVADFNADGKPDLLMRNASSGLAFAWFFDNVTPIGDQYLFSIDPAWKVEATGDFNRDGQPDLLFRSMGSGLAFAWNTAWNGTTLSLGAASEPIFAIDPAWEVVQVADWDRDGNADLLFRNTGSGLVFVWYMVGTTLAGSDFINQIDPTWEIVPRH